MCIVQGHNEVRWHLEQKTSFPPPCSNLRSFGSKCTVLKKVLMTLLERFGSPQWFGDRGIVPLAPIVTSLVSGVMQWNRKKIPESKQIFKSERHEHLQFSKTIRNGSCTDCQQTLLAAFQVSSCSFMSLLWLPHAFFRCGLVLVLLIMKLFGHSTSCFFKVR